MTTPTNSLINEEHFTPINEAGEEVDLTDIEYESLNVIEPDDTCDIFYDIYLDSVEMTTSVYEIFVENVEKSFHYVGEIVVEAYNYLIDCIEYYIE